MRARIIAVSLLLLPWMLSACHAGGTGGLPGMSPQSVTAMGNAAFTVNVPAPSGAAAPSIQSIVVTLMSVDGNSSVALKPVQMNVTAGASGCTKGAAQSLLCVVHIAVPAGRDTFRILTFPLPNALGKPISADQVTTAVRPLHQTACVKKSGTVNNQAPAAAAGKTGSVR